MKVLFTGAVLAAALLIAGCAHKPSVNTISNAESSAQIKRIADRRVETDPRLAQRLYLTEIRESTTNDGYKRVQVFFKNLSGNTYRILYRFNWYDENGVEVESPDNELWKRKSIVTGDDLTLTTVAPRKSCGDFKLRLKVVE